MFVIAVMLYCTVLYCTVLQLTQVTQLMNHCFSSHSVQLRETAHNFFEKELAPHASDIDRDNNFPKFRVREVATLATLIARVGGSRRAGRVGYSYQRVRSGEGGSLVPEGGERGEQRRVGRLYQRVGSGEGSSLVPEGGSLP